MGKPKVLNVFFTSVFTGKIGLQKSQAPEISVRVWSREDLPSVENIQIKEHGFMKGNSCLTNPIGFHDEMTDLVDEGRAVAVIYLDFSKTSDPPIHTEKQMKYKLFKPTVRWTENWLNCHIQRIVISDTYSS